MDGKGGTYCTAENVNTLIPEGVYLIDVCYSPAFKKKLPLIYNAQVPATRGIRLHEGNFPTTQSKGCVLVGNGVDLNNVSITDSKKAMEQLLKNCGDRLEITSIIEG